MTSLILPDNWVNNRRSNYVYQPQNYMPVELAEADNAPILLQQSTGYPLMYVRTPPGQQVASVSVQGNPVQTTTKSRFQSMYLFIVLVVFALIGAFLGAAYDMMGKSSGPSSSLDQAEDSYPGEGSAEMSQPNGADLINDDGY